MYKFDKGLLVLNNDKKSELFDIIQSDIHDKGAERFVPFLSSKSHHRSHANSVKIANGKASPANFEYFANSLKIVGKDDPAFKHPKDRVALGGHVILTIEFDGATDADGADLTREFFDFQIGWFRANKKPSDSIFGQFLTGLRQRYYDLIGSCPAGWCRNRRSTAGSGSGQAARAGRLTMGLWLTEPRVSSVM